MTDKGKTPDPEALIELVNVIDWRYVALALLAGAAVAFVVLSLIEHTDDIPLADGE